MKKLLCIVLIIVVVGAVVWLTPIKEMILGDSGEELELIVGAENSWMGAEKTLSNRDLYYVKQVYYQKYSDKSELARIPNDEIWNQVPEFGCCYLFYTVTAGDPNWVIAYERHGGRFYSYDTALYLESMKWVDYYTKQYAAAAKKEDKEEVERCSAQIDQYQKEVTEMYDIYEFILNQGADATMTDKGYVKGKTRYTLFSSDQLRQFKERVEEAIAESERYKMK